MVCYTIYSVTMAGSTISTFDLSHPLTNLMGVNSLACEHFETTSGTQNVVITSKMLPKDKRCSQMLFISSNIVKLYKQCLQLLPSPPHFSSVLTKFSLALGLSYP